jgi:hypothetical protein
MFIFLIPSSGMWRQVGFSRTYFSEESVASIFRVDIIRELETTLAVRITGVLDFAHRPEFAKL